MEKNKLYVIGHEENVLCILENEADAEEMFMDICMEVLYEDFCDLVINQHFPVRAALDMCSYWKGYWFEEVPSLVKVGSCATCGLGKGPLSALGVQGKCYCTRSRLYEKSTHYCAEWKEKKKCQ